MTKIKGHADHMCMFDGGKAILFYYNDGLEIKCSMGANYLENKNKNYGHYLQFLHDHL